MQDLNGAKEGKARVSCPDALAPSHTQDRSYANVNLIGNMTLLFAVCRCLSCDTDLKTQRNLGTAKPMGKSGPLALLEGRASGQDTLALPPLGPHPGPSPAPGKLLWLNLPTLTHAAHNSKALSGRAHVWCCVVFAVCKAPPSCGPLPQMNIAPCIDTMSNRWGRHPTAV